MRVRHKPTGPIQPSNPQFVRQPTVLREWNPVSPATLWRQIQAGNFPKPLKLSQGITAWRRSELEAWASDPVSYTLKRGGSLKEKTLASSAVEEGV
jgi:predicted DNA-binding transcriptional regulator AlpA